MWTRGKREMHKRFPSQDTREESTGSTLCSIGLELREIFLLLLIIIVIVIIIIIITTTSTIIIIIITSTTTTTTTVAEACECGNEPSFSVKCGEFLD